MSLGSKFLYFCIVGATLVVSTLLFLAPVIGIKASYGLIACLISVGLFRFQRGTTQTFTDGRATKATLIGCFASIAVAIVWPQRVLLLLGFAVIYLFVGLEVFSDQQKSRYGLAAVSSLFFTTGATKFLTTGFYFGNGDVIKHVKFVQALTDTGTLHSIQSSTYQSFPGLQILITTISQTTEITAYSALILTGLFLSAILIPTCVFLYSRQFFTQQVALTAAVVPLLLVPTKFYSVYVFPQTIGLLFILTALVLIEGGNRTPRRTLAITVVGVGLSVFHHFTGLVATILFALVIGVSTMPHLRSVRENKTILATAFILTPLSVWAYRGQSFFDAIIINVTGVVMGWFGSSTAQTAFYWGRTPTTAKTPFQSLLTPDAVYFTGILAISLTGIALLLNRRPDINYRRALPYALIGVLALPLMIKTPITLKSQFRFQHLAVPFFALITGLGLASQRRLIKPIGVPLGVVLIVIVGTTGGFVGADTLTHNGTSEQHSFSDSEFQQIQEASEFARKSDQSISTLWVSSEMMELFGINRISRPRISEKGITSSGLLYYRTNWSDHIVKAGTSVYLVSIHMSGNWLQETVNTTNKVYTTGKTGYVWTGTTTTHNTSSAFDTE